MNPLISVIVPVYNLEKYIHRCINGVLNQIYKRSEVILTDNCP
jgi:glycosyltransferase involved in cell wall biosynthesis